MVSPCVAPAFAVFCYAVAGFASSVDTSVSYTWDPRWPKDNTSWVNKEYRPTAIAFVGAGARSTEIHMAERGNKDYPITTFDAAGNVLRRWGSPHILKAHGMTAQSEKNGTTSLWVADMGDYTVKKFDSATGQLLLVVGTPGIFGTGTSPLQFGNVSDITFSPDGSMMFIADGDCLCLAGGANHRVVAVHTQTLKVEWAVGNDGTFQNPHAVGYDAERQWVWVADREHNRTVALDAATGKVKGTWSVHDLQPSSHRSSINGLRVDEKRGLLVLGLMPAPIHSKGGEFQVAAWDLAAVAASTDRMPPPLYQKPIPVRGLHELDVDEATGDLYLALFEVGQVAHLFNAASASAEGVGTHPDFTLCDKIDQPPKILSHHLHVLFRGAARASMTAALEQRREFLKFLGIDETTCPMAHSDPAPTYSGICPFPFEFDPTAFPVSPGGPFEAPNFSFFVSDKFLQLAITWWESHRRYLGGELDVLVHANSGCQLNDHTVFGVWMGKQWEMNTVGLACCLNGPPGCSCYDTYYIARTKGGDEGTATSKCLAVNKTGGGVIYESCDLSSFNPSLMWHEVTYQKGYQEIDSLGWSMGRFSGVDNCMGVETCHAGAALSMTGCGKDELHNTRFHFQSNADDNNMGVLASDTCTGLCVLIDPSTGRTTLGDCNDPRGAVERRCVMAPGQAPVACPHKQMSLTADISAKVPRGVYI